MGEDILLQAEEAYKAMEQEAAEATAAMQKDADEAQAAFDKTAFSLDELI